MQALTVVSLTGWTLVTSYIILKLIDLTLGLRIPLHEELLGADIVEHGIGDGIYDRSTGRLIKRTDDSEEEEVVINRLMGSQRRRMSLGKRHSRKRQQFPGDEENMEGGEVHPEYTVNGNASPSYSPSKLKHTVSCCDCFLAHLRRDSRVSLPSRTSKNGAKRSRRFEPRSHDISTIHSPSTPKELKRTEYLHVKYGMENSSSNGHVGNGYANVGYGLSREPSSEFHVNTEQPSNGPDQVPQSKCPDVTPDFEMTYI